MNTVTMTNYRTRRAFDWDRFKRYIAEWQRRSRSRQELEGLSDASLHDIGITRCDVNREARKPFWMA